MSRSHKRSRKGKLYEPALIFPRLAIIDLHAARRTTMNAWRSSTNTTLVRRELQRAATLQGAAVSERDIKFRLTYRTLEYAGAKLEACCRM
jgi:hypothetical protein